MKNDFPKIGILVDDAAADGLEAEHGLSMLIEWAGKKILFDAGQGDALEHNSKKLGIDLSRIDAFVLSHGHYDHTGAVDVVMEQNPDVSVFAHSDILKTRYSLYPGQDPKESSMPSEERLIVENLPDSQLNWITFPTEIMPGLWLSGPIPRLHPKEDTGGPFYTDPEGTEADLINDDMAMWVETDDGVIVICGCCHSGLINTLSYIRAVSSCEHIRGVIGGLHLKNASEERLAATATMLEVYHPDFLVPCHCTGEATIDFFKQRLTSEIQTGFAGFKL